MIRHNLRMHPNHCQPLILKEAYYHFPRTSVANSNEADCLRLRPFFTKGYNKFIFYVYHHAHRINNSSYIFDLFISIQQYFSFMKRYLHITEERKKYISYATGRLKKIM